MKGLKKNKGLICFIIALILFLVLVAFFIKALLPTGSSPWGNRLDGIEEHEIAAEDIEKIKTAIKESGKVSEVTYNRTGRVLRFIIYVNDDVSRGDASGLVGNITNVISAEDQQYYDIEVFIDKNIEADDFPIFAYKHKTSSYFSFNK